MNITHLLRLARAGDTDAATELLGIAAAYLRAREPIPDALADHIASAFADTARLKPNGAGKLIDSNRRFRLAASLRLTKVANRPRKSIEPGPIALAMVVKGDSMSEHQIAKKLAGIFDVTPNTIRARMAEAAATMDEGRRLLANIVTR